MRRAAALTAIALAVILVLIMGLFLFPPRPLLGLAAVLHPEVLFFVETESPAVALTFDDGPHAELTPQILDLLQAHDARATFFLLGDRIEGNETLLAEINVSGHELANHLQFDEPSFVLSAEDFERQLVHVDSLIAVDSRIAENGGSKWFRPGSGWFHPRMLRQLEDQGYRCSLGSFYPLDPMLRSPALIAEQILGRLFAGAIIILHEGRDDRARILPVLERILPEIKARGYEIVTLSELVAMDPAQSAKR